MKKLTYLIAILILSLSSFASSTEKNPFDLATQYYEQQNYKMAIKYFKKVAEQGNVVAQYNLGLIYYYKVKNYTQAFKWYKKSAKQGDPNAQFRLGSMYIQGKGVKESFDKAVYWLKKSARKGNADAQSVLKTLKEKY